MALTCNKRRPRFGPLILPAGFNLPITAPVLAAPRPRARLTVRPRLPVILTGAAVTPAALVAPLPAAPRRFSAARSRPRSLSLPAQSRVPLVCPQLGRQRATQLRTARSKPPVLVSSPVFIGTPITAWPVRLLTRKSPYRWTRSLIVGAGIQAPIHTGPAAATVFPDPFRGSPAAKAADPFSGTIIPKAANPFAGSIVVKTADPFSGSVVYKGGAI